MVIVGNSTVMVVERHGHGGETAWSWLWNSMVRVVEQHGHGGETVAVCKSSPTFLTTFMSESGVHTPVLKSAALSSKIKSERDGSPLNIPKLGTLSQRGGDLT